MLIYIFFSNYTITHCLACSGEPCQTFPNIKTKMKLRWSVFALWLCREGLISRAEITAYFMRASVICSKLGLGFVHNFQETTYMKPTFCDNCSGFVSPPRTLTV